MVIQLQMGVVVEAGLTKPLSEEQFATLTQKVSATNPYDCQFLLGEYNCKYNRFQDCEVKDVFDIFLDQVHTPPVRFERIKYRK